MVRAFLVVILAAAAATTACSLNPQPLPPEDTNGFNADAGATKDSSTTGADAATPPTDDAGLDGSVTSDAAPDGHADAGDAGLDAGDAGDAGDAAEDAVTE